MKSYSLLAVSSALLVSGVSACDQSAPEPSEAGVGVATAALDQGVRFGTKGVHYRICSEELRLNLGSCCGNAKVDADNGEQCDDGNDDDTDGCRNDCTAATCGDGIVQEGVEACDDGNDNPHDGCTTACGVAVCGDGFVHAGVEGCDNGDDNDIDGPCFPDCTAEVGYVPAGDFWMGCNPA